MKKKILILGLLVLLGAVSLALLQKRPVPIPMRIDLTGTAGVKVAGKVVVDGVEREFSGTLPTHLAVQARSIEYTIRMQEPQGELRGELTVAGNVWGSSATSGDFRGVRGSYYRGWFGKGGMMTTVEKEK